MKIIVADNALPEVKRRIRALLKDVKDSDITVEGVIINDKHRIHFTLRNENYAMTGDIYERLTSLKLVYKGKRNA